MKADGSSDGLGERQEPARNQQAGRAASAHRLHQGFRARCHVHALAEATLEFLLVEAGKRCGDRIPGNQTTRFCDFDLALAEVQQARYFKVEDAEHFPCEDAGTPSEGADIDAVRILQAGP